MTGHSFGNFSRPSSEGVTVLCRRRERLNWITIVILLFRLCSIHIPSQGVCLPLRGKPGFKYTSGIFCLCCPDFCFGIFFGCIITAGNTRYDIRVFRSLHLINIQEIPMMHGNFISTLKYLHIAPGHTHLIANHIFVTCKAAIDLEGDRVCFTIQNVAVFIQYFTSKFDICKFVVIFRLPNSIKLHIIRRCNLVARKIPLIIGS